MTLPSDRPDFRYGLSLACCLASISSFSQTQATTSEPPVFTVVEEMPQFPGGELALFQYLKEEVRYPPEALAIGASGTVYTTFIVQEDGTVKDPLILRGVNEWLDNEALRVVGTMPTWTPGRSKGMPCRVQFNLPIKFTIAAPDKELVVDVMPSFPGGEAAEHDFVLSKLSLHEHLFAFETEGTVLASFVVELDGSFSDVRVDKSLRADVDSMVIEIVRSMPKWTPAICAGVPCRSRYELPFNFSRPPVGEAKAAVEVMPTFPGGERELFNFLGKNLVYPSSAMEDGVGGTVYLTYVIDVDGSIQNITVLRGVRADLDRAAVNVIKKMPLWNPGMQDGEPVRVQYNLPVRFTVR